MFLTPYNKKHASVFQTSLNGSRINAGVTNVGVDKRRSDKCRSGHTHE